ncbi:polysaccharide biosynthesis/export family protein [Paracoccus xiamenensis]|uniref:polysaccharide biosynthesis/export family protein n=1 Tax=Paracoccus xiamenensis TaxID=2714901 RepID=UPI001407C4EC|nr:polysaccharide biosynthesis/export family protein [Paracoccus xiamenensis]NHF73090.1 hypothetical protein [Paracoccus xiamenensis]
MTARRRGGHIAQVCALAVGCWLALASMAPAQEPYRLHAQDRLLIRVMTWDFRQNSMTGWEGLSGEYTISPEGNLHLPLAGVLSAKGLTQEELADAISDLLRGRAGLDEPPQLSIELAASLPVFVLGAVEARGAVPFHPGLTARQALALAGGIFRAPQSADIVRGIMLSGEATEAADRLQSLRAEEERIRAELEALSLGDVAPDPSGPDADVQTRLQAAERHARQVRLDSYQDLQTVLQQRSDRLAQQIALRDQQIANTRKELEDITSLNERGLTVNARVTALTTALSDLESRRLDLEIAQLLLDEQLNQAQRDSSTITTDAVAERLLRLTALESEISAAEIRERSARAQFTAMMDASGTRSSEAPSEADLQFLLTRDGTRTQVQPDTVLAPGDTLDIATPTVTEASE